MRFLSCSNKPSTAKSRRCQSGSVERFPQLTNEVRCDGSRCSRSIGCPSNEVNDRHHRHHRHGLQRLASVPMEEFIRDEERQWGSSTCTMLRLRPVSPAVFVPQVAQYIFDHRTAVLHLHHPAPQRQHSRHRDRAHSHLRAGRMLTFGATPRLCFALCWPSASGPSRSRLRPSAIRLTFLARMAAGTDGRAPAYA